MKIWIKYLKCSAVALMTLLFFSCQKDEPVSPYTLQDIEGTWMWTIIDGEYNTNMWVDWITAEGKDTCRYRENDKWQERGFPISVKKGVISADGLDEEYLIINVDDYTLVVEGLKSKIRMTAERAYEKDRKFLVGTWHADTYTLENTILTNHTITYYEDGTYVAKYDGGEPVNGTYSILNDFLFYQSDHAGVIRMEVGMGETGLQTTEVILTSDGDAIVNYCQRVKDGPQITYEDLDKTWITTTKDGAPIPLNEAAICKVIGEGHSIISYVENGTWVSKDVTLVIKDNIITRVIGTTTEKFDVMYFDRETIIWKNLSTGSVVTRKAIREPDCNKEKILGYWYDEESDIKVVCTEDSAFFKTPEYEISGAYQLYGEILVAYNDAGCDMSVVEFGYDAERKERYVKQIVMDGEVLVTNTFYKPNLANQLAGGWIWTRENGERVPTSKLELSFYNPMTGMHDYQTFGEGAEHILEPYYIEGRTIYYPEDTEDLPYETIMSIDDSLLVTKGSDGITYRASRISMENPLNEKIIGEWTCHDFIDMDIHDFTHIFDKNGLVTCIVDGTMTNYGTYRLYNSLLVIQISGPFGMSTILWVIKDKKIENGTMTFSKLLEDGSTIENVLTKKEYTVNDLVGTWIWTMNANEQNNSFQITAVEYRADGTETRWYIKDNKWVPEEGTFSVKDGYFTNSGKQKRKIIHLDENTFVLENPETLKRSSSEKVTTLNHSLLFGTWRCEPYNDGEKSMDFTQREFREDGTYTVLAPNGSREGKYMLLNNYLFRQGVSSAECVYLTFDQDQNGITMNQRTMSKDGKQYDNLFRKQ